MSIIGEMCTLVAVYVECLAHGISLLFTYKVTNSSCHCTICKLGVIEYFLFLEQNRRIVAEILGSLIISRDGCKGKAGVIGNAELFCVGLEVIGAKITYFLVRISEGLRGK